MNKYVVAATAASLAFTATTAHAGSSVGVELGGNWNPGNSFAAKNQDNPDINSQANCHGDRNSFLAQEFGKDWGQAHKEGGNTERNSLYFYLGAIVGLTPLEVCSDFPVGGG